MLHAVGLGTKLRRLLSLLDGDLQDIYIAEGCDFRPKFYPVMIALMREDGQDVLSLAAAAQVTQPAMTQTLQAMQICGLVSLQRGSDRRQRVVTLTSAGRATVDRLTPLWGAVATAAAALEEECSASLIAVLDEALCALERKSFRKRIEEALP